MNSFEKFLADMGEKPEGKSLDRIDNNAGYSPNNCRWATPQEQARNTRRNRWLTYAGKTMVLEDWARELKVSCCTLKARLRRGWDVKQALVTPVRRKAQRRGMKYAYNGGNYTLVELSKLSGVSLRTLSYRLRTWDVVRAVETPVKN
jgi:hypothetical protein